MANSNTTELFEALTLLAKEKGIDPAVLIEKIQTALVIAIKKEYPRSENIKFDIDIAKGKFDVAIQKEVAAEVEDDANQISMEEAKTHTRRKLEYGDIVAIKLDTQHFGRIAAQTAKQVIKQGLKEIEREQLVAQWGGLQDEAVTVTVLKTEPRTGNATVNLNGNEVPLFRSEQIPGEVLKPGDMVKVYVSGVSATDHRPMLKISRVNKELVKRLFEAEVAEVKDGTVEIKSIAREAGSRTKMAVWSNDPNVDPVGACVGMNGARVNAVVQELRGEKIDIINWDENPALLIENALSPAKVISVMADPDAKVASVIVPDYQLSLAIGKEGQNARLAARLTGYKIDIKSETQAIESGELPENYMEQMGMVGEEGYTVGEYDEEEENTEAAVDETDSDEIEFVETDVE